MLGVLGAIAAVQPLRADGFAPRRPIEVVAFAGEEPRFGTGCVGSRASAGDSRARTSTGCATATASAWPRPCAYGLDPDRLETARTTPRGARLRRAAHRAGRVLEDAGEPIGVVTAIAAPHDLA